MPKKVDRDARRAEISDALLRIAAERGLEAVSLRHVADEAGVSTGMVQHYFRTKDEMMTFALGAIQSRTEGRLTATIAALGESPEPGVLLRTLLVGLLPMEEPGLADGRVALAFLASAAARPHLAAALVEGNAQLHAHVAALIERIRPGTRDPHRVAVGLLAMVEGLGVYRLGGQCTSDEAVAVLDRHLESVL